MKYIRNFSTVLEATSADDLVSPNLSMINTDSGNKLLAIDSGTKDQILQIKLDDSGEPVIKKTYTVILDASGNGTVGGGGLYAEGTSITITAIANEGYEFEKWSDNDTNATRTITVNSNKNLTATFEEETVKVTIKAIASINIDSTSGSGQYNVGDSVTLRAVVEGGRRFVGWYDGIRQKTLFSVSNPWTFIAENNLSAYAVGESDTPKPV